MLKKITVVLLGVCVTSMTLTGVSAADFSDGMTMQQWKRIHLQMAAKE